MFIPPNISQHMIRTSIKTIGFDPSKTIQNHPHFNSKGSIRPLLNYVQLLASGLYPAKVLAGIAFGEFHFRDQLGLLPPLLKLCSEVASSRNFLPLGDGKVRFFNPDTLVSSLLDVAAFGN